VVSLSRHTAPPPAPSLFPYTTLFRSVGNTSVCRTDAYPAVPTIDRLIHPSVKSPEIRMLRQWRVLASCCRRDPGHEPDQRVPGGGVVMSMHGESEVLLTPAEVASLFRVDPKTVTRWEKAGKLSSIRTLGGHRRYRESEWRALLGAASAPAEGTDKS